jgi:hypothetical protein
MVATPSTPESHVSDNVTVELGGKSKYEIACAMAREIFQIEGGFPKERAKYLSTVYECLHVLNGVNPSISKPKGF